MFCIRKNKQLYFLFLDKIIIWNREIVKMGNNMDFFECYRWNDFEGQWLYGIFGEVRLWVLEFLVLEKYLVFTEGVEL